MSAIAFIICKDKIHLFSDGCAIGDDDEIVSQKANKNELINSKVGVQKVGYWNKKMATEGIRGDLDINPNSSPMEVAEEASELLKNHYKNDPDYNPDDSFYNSKLLVLGFNSKDEPQHFLIESDNGFNVKPIPITNLPFLASLVTDERGRPPFHDLIREYLPEKRNFFEAGEQAFTDMVKIYENTGRVGGKIFTETISL